MSVVFCSWGDALEGGGVEGLTLARKLAAESAAELSWLVIGGVAAAAEETVLALVLAVLRGLLVAAREDLQVAPGGNGHVARGDDRAAADQRVAPGVHGEAGSAEQQEHRQARDAHGSALRLQVHRQ